MNTPKPMARMQRRHNLVAYAIGVILSAGLFQFVRAFVEAGAR